VFKFHIDPLITGGKTRYTITIYDMGVREGYYKSIIKPDYALHYLLRYRQSLLENKWVSYRWRKVKARGSGEIADKLLVAFYQGSERHAQIYRLYLISILNIRSIRRVDKLARCFSNLDPVSPVLDTLQSLEKMVEPKKFVQILRGYCLCLK